MQYKVNMETDKTDLEKVRERIKNRLDGSKDFDRLRLFIEIKEIVRFLHDIFNTTNQVVSSNFMEFFERDELYDFYNGLADLSIDSADLISKFDRLLGIKKDERDLDGKKIEKNDSKEPPALLKKSEAVSNFNKDRPRYVV